MIKRMLVLLTVVGPVFFAASCVKNTTPPSNQHDSTGTSSPDTGTYTLVLQPDSLTGQDSWVSKLDNHTTDGDKNLDWTHELVMARYIFSEHDFDSATQRAYVRFDSLSKIPDSATVLSATLYLYGEPSSVVFPFGNSYPSFSSLPNTSLVQRVVGGNWDQKTITWNNAPALSPVGQDTIPASTSAFNYSTSVNVTNIVKLMVKTPCSNFGFGLRLATETTNRSLLFASCEVADAARRPKLVVTWKK